MNHLDLFSGIGGFSLAAQKVWGEEHNIVAFVEQDKFCQKVLNKHWSLVPIFEDIKEFKYEQTIGGGPVTTAGFKCGEYQQPSIDLLTGGFPCQPFSVAGKRKGKEDDRWLWHEMLRIIKESKPSWIIGENVSGIINMELDNCITELEGEGYEVQTFIIPACAVDARHRRDRVWIVANRISMGWNEGTSKGIQSKIRQPEGQKPEHVCKGLSKDRYVANAINCTDRTIRGQKGKEDSVQGIEQQARYSRLFGRTSKDAADTGNEGLQGSKEARNTGENREEPNDKQFGRCNQRRGAIWSVEPDVGRVAHGIPSRVDRLKALGNAIVPQVVMPIMQVIKEIDEHNQSIGISRIHTKANT